MPMWALDVAYTQRRPRALFATSPTLVLCNLDSGGECPESSGGLCCRFRPGFKPWALPCASVTHVAAIR